MPSGTELQVLEAVKKAKGRNHCFVCSQGYKDEFGLYACHV